jgi:deoxycytidylate deaminase
MALHTGFRRWCPSLVAPQAVCPRNEEDDYTKCRTVCGQTGHAEENAIALAREAGLCIQGGRAIVTGHYWICQSCGNALRAAGVSEIVVKVAA